MQFHNSVGKTDHRFLTGKCYDANSKDFYRDVSFNKRIDNNILTYCYSLLSKRKNLWQARESHYHSEQHLHFHLSYVFKLSNCYGRIGKYCCVKVATGERESKVHLFTSTYDQYMV